MTLFKKLKTASRTTKGKLVRTYAKGKSVYVKGKAIQQKVVNSKVYKNAGRATRNVEYALKNPAQEIRSPQARRFRQRSNQFGKIMYGDRMNRRWNEMARTFKWYNVKIKGNSVGQERAMNKDNAKNTLSKRFKVPKSKVTLRMRK